MKRLFLLLALLASACTVPPAPVITPVPPRPVGIHTCVPGATVWFDGVSNGITVPSTPFTTNAQGYGGIAAFPADITTFNVHATAANHDPYGVVVTVPATGSIDLFFGDCESNARTYPYVAQLNAWPENFTPLPTLHVEGEYFKLQDGTRWLGIETSDFSLFARWLDGEDITPILQQRKDLGFNLLRVWTRFCNIPGIYGCSTLDRHPDLYDRLPAFLKLVSKYGFYVDLLAYVGPNNETDPQHWNKLCTAVQGSAAKTAVLLSRVNENDVHPITDAWFDALQPCAGILSSRGSNGSQAIPPHADGWQWTEFHDNSAPEWQRKGGHNGWEIGEQFHVPVITNEQTSADNDGNLAHWQDVGASIPIFVAGGAFHSSQGKDSVLFTGLTLTLAEQFAQNMKMTPLYCRELSYQCLSCDNPSAWIPPYLRVYQRGGDVACRVTIRP